MTANGDLLDQAEARRALDALRADLRRILLTSKEAAAALAMSERQLWQLTSDGDIPVVRTGRTGRFVRYRIEALQRWAERNERKGLTG